MLILMEFEIGRKQFWSLAFKQRIVKIWIRESQFYICFVRRGINKFDDTINLQITQVAYKWTN